EPHPRIRRRPLDSCFKLASNVGRQFFGPSDHLERDVVGKQRVELEPQIPLQEHHQRVDLGPRALPVLNRKRIQSEDTDPRSSRCFDDVADRIDAGAVPFDAWKMSLSRPSTVAVHDDGDMGRQPLEIDLTRQKFVRGTGRNTGGERLKRHSRPTHGGPCPTPRLGPASAKASARARRSNEAWLRYYTPPRR